MAAGDAAKKTGKGPTPEPGLTPAPGNATVEPVAAEVDPDRTYLALRDTEEVNAEGCPLWAELGEVTATTKPDAWSKAKVKWPSLVPDPPTGPDAPVATVRAKLIPKRYSGTIDSSMEYVPPRAVTKGI